MAWDQEEDIWIIIVVIKVIVIEFSFSKVGIFSISKFYMMNSLCDLDRKIFLLVLIIDNSKEQVALNLDQIWTIFCHFISIYFDIWSTQDPIRIWNVHLT